MQELLLSDGRRIEFEVTGPENGDVLLHHHGTPGSLVQRRVLQRAAHTRGLRMVTYSRPGYGGSSRLPGRDVAAVTADCTALLDHLGADRCVTTGWSGGGPHALALAAMRPDRVAGVSTFAGVMPYGIEGTDFLAGMGEGNVKEFGLVAQGEAAIRPYLEARALTMRVPDPAGLLKTWASILPATDKAVLSEEFGSEVAAGVAEAVRNGVSGWLDDDLAFARPWGFALEDLAVPSFVWQGSADLMVPFAHGQWLARNLPGATAHLKEGEGHMSIVLAAADEIVEELAATLR